MERVELHSDFKEFLRFLNDADARYLVIGGYAVAYHGYPRATNDLDVWIDSDPDNIRKVGDVLRRFGFTDPTVTQQWMRDPRKMLRMGYPPVRIEVRTEIAGVSFQEAHPRRVDDTIDDVEVHLIGLHELKKNKRAAGRHKDLADLENLP